MRIQIVVLELHLGRGDGAHRDRVLIGQGTNKAGEDGHGLLCGTEPLEEKREGTRSIEKVFEMFTQEGMWTATGETQVKTTWLPFDREL